MRAGVARDDFEAYALPRASVARTSVLTAVFGLVPVVLALLWLTRGTAHWPAVIWAADVAVVVGLICYWRYCVSFVGVTADEFIKRGWLPGFVRLPRESIAAVVVVRTYRSGSTETVPQLFATDAAGTPLFRMRGSYWSEEAIAVVTDALGSPTTTVPKPMSFADLYRQYPGSRSWYEGRPVLAALAVVVLFALGAGGLTLLWGALLDS
jgi:hypothetical protein